MAKKVLSFRSLTTTRSTWPSRSVMMLRSRSCVIGRGVAMFSICSAMAFASKMPTQIGRTRSPSLSLRITMGMLVIGSTISPLMRHFDQHGVLSLRRIRCLQRQGRLAPQAVRPRPRDPDRHRAPDPCARRRSPSYRSAPENSLRCSRSSAPRALRALRAGSPSPPGRRHVAPTASSCSRGLNLPLQRLQRHDARRLLVLAHIVRHPLRRPACSAAAST